MECRVPAESASPGGAATSGPRPTDREGLLQQSREFLDFFWDIAKPEQETRLEATEKLLGYLRARPQVRRRAGGARLTGQGLVARGGQGRGRAGAGAARRRAGAGQGRAAGVAVRPAGPPYSLPAALAPAGTREEVRPEAPHHRARGRPRDRPALL